MKFCIIIPAHNEAKVISQTIESLINQTLLPSELIVVNDNSTDNTARIITTYAENYDWITLVNSSSMDKHLPGAKIINAFYKGFECINKPYDIICKFDADLIFPANYLETISSHFQTHKKLGMASGFCYIKNNSEHWVLENLTNKDHIRGALKAYRKTCFEDIGQLKRSMGWDTVDELLAKFHGWQIITDETLHVKHLKPTGQSYNKASKYLQGEAMYKMRYGFWITLLSALKLAFKKRKIHLFFDYMSGYFRAKKQNTAFLVSKEEGTFIRQLRWEGIKQSLF